MRSFVISGLLILLAINTGWFVVYSASLGLEGLIGDAPESASRVFAQESAVASVALASHMIAGAILTCAAPLQALPILRRRWPAIHRRSGYVLLTLAGVTGVGGLVYIALAGTIGGWWMSLWFAVYGALILWSAANTVYFAIEKDFDRHSAWATRFVILAVGSWIYRMHYAIWYGFADGRGSNETLSGPFDQVQVFAFYVPYLLVAELVLRWRSKQRQSKLA